MRFRLLFAATCFAGLGCGHPDENFESVIQVVRRDVVEKDEKGEAIQVDMEMEWDPCPGDQLQVIRGGPEFAKCTEKYKVGDYLPVKVKHFWDPRGTYRWDIYEMGDCKRDIEAYAEGSYEKSQECDDEKAYGRTVGFKCSRRPFRKLVSICPWMARQ